jgi:hypothetical protein
VHNEEQQDSARIHSPHWSLPALPPLGRPVPKNHSSTPRIDAQCRMPRRTRYFCTTPFTARRESRDWRSTSGHKRTSGVVRLMSALPAKAKIRTWLIRPARMAWCFEPRKRVLGIAWSSIRKAGTGKRSKQRQKSNWLDHEIRAGASLKTNGPGLFGAGPQLTKGQGTLKTVRRRRVDD